MALKNPSQYFKKDIVSVDNSIIKNSSSSQLNTFSDAFESFKQNLNKIEILSEFSDTLDNYLGRVTTLSEQVEGIQTEIQSLLKKEDLDRAMMSQLLVVEQSIRDIQSKVKSINDSKLTEIRLDVSNLTNNVSEFLNVEVPKYKKLIVGSEIRANKRYEELEYGVNKTLEEIGELVENKYQHLTETLHGINEKSLAGILEDFRILDENFIKLRKEDIPKYKGFIVENERKTEHKLEEFNEVLSNTTEQLLQKINSVEGDKVNLIKVVNDKIQEVVSLRDLVIGELQQNETSRNDLKNKVTNLEVEIIRNESHIRVQNNNLKKIQEEVFSTIKKLNLDELEEKNYELSKKVKYLEEVFEKFNEKEILTENIIVEPPSVDNKDPLTPLNKNFVTLEQLQEHYRIFVNRIQQQLATIGGGGETRLKYLDDIVGIATNPSAYDGKFLKYDHSQRKFQFETVNQGNTENINTNSISIVDTDSSNLYSGDVVSLQKAYIALTETTSPTSIHKLISAQDYASVEYLIQASKDLDVDTRKIIVVNNITSINKSETHLVSTGSTFVGYDLNIEDGYINLIATPTTSSKVIYSILYTAIARPLLKYQLTDEIGNTIFTEDGNMLIAEDY